MVYLLEKERLLLLNYGSGSVVLMVVADLVISRLLDYDNEETKTLSVVILVED